MLTIVVYHYVRDEESRFPAMKARTVAEFAGQLDYIERHYEPVGLEDVRDAYAEGRGLPSRACLLTFDDGLRDHRDVVLPELVRRGLSGCFAPSSDAVLHRRLLGVQKSQFVLAAEPDRARVLDRLFALIEQFAGSNPELTPEALRRRYIGDDRFDDPETTLVKRLLQYGLPEEIRGDALTTLFAEVVGEDEAAFADNLYLSLADVRELRAAGMGIAGHGVSHDHFAMLDLEHQRRSIVGTARLLAEVEQAEPQAWTMCYPSGSYDSTTLALLRHAGCALGMTVAAGLAGPRSDSLTLPRLDTNDLPLSADEPPVAWTLAAGYVADERSSSAEISSSST